MVRLLAINDLLITTMSGEKFPGRRVEHRLDGGGEVAVMQLSIDQNCPGLVAHAHVEKITPCDFLYPVLGKQLAVGNIFLIVLGEIQRNMEFAPGSASGFDQSLAFVKMLVS